MYDLVKDSATSITGGRVAHGFTKLPPAARALAAADWHAGRTALLNPTLKQAARAYLATVPEVRLARQVAGRSDLRAAVMAGDLYLATAARFAATRAAFDAAHGAGMLAGQEMTPAAPIDHTPATAPTSPTVPTTTSLAVAIETASDAELGAVVAPRLGRFWAALERVTHPLSIF